MMSSCSQEDVQVAEPHIEGIKVSAGLKVAAAPSIPTTGGWPGDHVFAPGWEKVIVTVPDDKQFYSAGTSTKTHLWGNPYMPWIKPLPQLLPNNGNNIGNFITFMGQKSNGTSTAVEVVTKIKNLVPGKKYAVTFFLSSTSRLKNGQPTDYAQSVSITIAGMIQQNPGSLNLVDLKGKEAEWVSKTVKFEAQSTETNVFFQTCVSQQYYNSHAQYFHYANVFVPQNAVIEEVP